MIYRLSLCFASYHPHSALFSDDVDALMGGLVATKSTYTHVRPACIERELEYQTEDAWKEGILRIKKCAKYHALGSMSVALKATMIGPDSYQQTHPLNNIKILLSGRG